MALPKEWSCPSRFPAKDVSLSEDSVLVIYMKNENHKGVDRWIILYHIGMGSIAKIMMLTEAFLYQSMSHYTTQKH